jgi:hypothetical protein
VSRDITTASRRALYGAETGEAFVILLTLTHAGLSAPIRISSDAVDTQSRGEVFIAYPFDLTLPDDEESRAPRARLVIDNVDRQIISALRGLTTAPVVSMEIVRAADPDAVEAVFSDFRLTNVTYDSQVIEADLGIEDFTAEPYPAASFSPSLFPGMF